jgi:hypothetical protein
MIEFILNFQYQYSKLFNFGFNRKKFEINSTAERFYSMNTSKNTFIALLFTLVASGHLFSGLFLGLNSAEKLGFEFYLMSLFFFAVGLIGFRQFLWLTNGRQELTIENGTLTLYKKGAFLMKPKIYLMKKVENVRHAFDEENLTLYDKIQNNIRLNRKVLFGHIFGQILFDYDGKIIKIFSDLDKGERIKLINEINKRK